MGLKIYNFKLKTVYLEQPFQHLYKKDSCLQGSSQCEVHNSALLQCFPPLCSDCSASCSLNELDSCVFPTNCEGLFINQRTWQTLAYAPYLPASLNKAVQHSHLTCCPGFSTVPATKKKINSIPAKIRTRVISVAFQHDVEKGASNRHVSLAPSFLTQLWIL